MKLKDKVRNHYEKHPKFRYFMNVIDKYMDKLQTFFIFFFVLYFAALLILFLIATKLSFSNGITAVFGLFITAFAAPVCMHFIKTRNDKKEEIMKLNRDLYEKFIDCLMPLYANDDHTDKYEVLLNQLIKENIGHINLYFPVSTINLLAGIFDERSPKGCRDNQKKFIELIISRFRKQIGIKDDYFIMRNIIEITKEIDDN